MNAEIFAEWLRRQGHRVVRSPSSFWFNAGVGAYQAFPYHWLVRPSERELHHLLLANRAIALRYSTPLDSPQGCISYHAVYQEPQYALELLDRRSRQNVRTGLGQCTVEPISFKRLAEEGWLLDADTAHRQNRKPKMDRKKWQRYCDSAVGLAGFEAWGAIADNRLVASLLVFQMNDWCEFLSQQCHRIYLSKRINNALAFAVTKTVLSRPGVNSIFYSLQSLSPSQNIDEFKFRMGYIAKAVRQRVVLHPSLAPLVQPALVVALRKIATRIPAHSFLPKLVGMLQFYIEGQRPFEAQALPLCLQRAGHIGIRDLRSASGKAEEC
jgi:hypothetical protein